MAVLGRPRNRGDARDQPAAQQLGPLGDVTGHYRGHGVLSTVDGLQPIERVTAGLLDALASPTRDA